MIGGEVMQRQAGKSVPSWEASQFQAARQVRQSEEAGRQEGAARQGRQIGPGRHVKARQM